METADGNCIQIPDEASEAASAAGAAGSHAHTGGQDRGKQGDRRALPDVFGQGADPEGQELPTSQMGSTDSDAGVGQEAAGECQEDGAAPERAAGNDGGQGLDHPIPRPESTGCTEGAHSAVEIADQPQERSGLRVAGAPCAQRHMDGGGSNDEATHPCPVPHGHDASEPDGPEQGQRTEQRQRQIETEDEHGQECSLAPQLVKELTQLAGHLRLTNNRNWCFANSTVHSLLWTLLSLQVPLTDLWGEHHAELIQFVQKHAYKPATLSETAWFLQVVQDWIADGEQQDCAECAHRVLRWLRPAAFDMRWERRVATSEGLQLHDSNSNFMPIILYIPSHAHHTGHCQLASLVSAWSQELAMQTALMDAPVCLCLHIDRMYQDADNQAVKSMCRLDIDTEIMMPVFRPSGIACNTAGYIPVACIAHFGQDQAGHCKALLKIQPTVVPPGNPAAWLMTEDDQYPTPLWQFPSWFASNLTVVWMIRTDCLKLLLYRVRSDGTTMEAAPDDHSDQAFIHLLQAQHGASLPG